MIKSNQGLINKKVLYAQAVYGDEEKQAVLKSFDNGWLASGPLVKEFEEKVAKLFGKKYGIALNSGSSATLLSVKTAIKFNKQRLIKHIITPACTFSTTVSAILNSGIHPLFVDSIIGRYTANEDQIENILSERSNVCAILVPQLIGGIVDMPRLRKLADKYNIYLIDDSCDTFAPMINGKTIASYSDLTCTSFYGSHIITAMGIGGMIMTDNEKFRDYIIMLRDWGRYGDDREEFKKRFDFKIDNIPYDSKFIYGDYGFNLKLNEASAAFGLEQLKRLDKFLEIRKDNFNSYTDFFKQYEDYFYLPYLIKGAQTNWLAYPLTIKNAPFTRYELLEYLEKNGIQTRVLFSGNITRHDAYRGYLKEFINADYIMANGFLLGCHQGLEKKDIEYVKKIFKDFFNRYV
jgi:CDP-6-deoxy-D-xylo-4-hexulose-3-dehydrase